MSNSHLDPLLDKVHLISQLLPEEDVWVVCGVEGQLELLELLLGEDGAVPSLSLVVGIVAGAGAGDDGP